MKVLHIITALNVGGAETMLAKLVEHERERGGSHQLSVVSLMPPGAAGARIAASGVTVLHCGIDHATAFPAGLLRLRGIIRQVDPDLIMAWMYHAHIAAVLGTLLAHRNIPLVWNVRHSIDDLRQEKPVLRAVVRLAARLSRVPDMIIYNSQTAARQHRRLGFRDKHALVIPNGFDHDLFRPRAGSRQDLVSRFGINPDALIVGMAARNHPMKDPANLIEAVIGAREAGADVHLLLTGEGMDRPSGRLKQLVGKLPADRRTLRGHDPSLASLLPGLDLFVLPSAWGEAFPNILGEAMACGVPCIATDVGDSRAILGETGLVVPPRDPRRLTDAILSIAALGEAGRGQLGSAARERVKQQFSMREVGALYADIYNACSRSLLRQEKTRPETRQPQVM